MTTLPSTVQERFALPAGAGGKGSEGGTTMTAADVMGILRRRLVLIVILFTLLSALVVGGFIVWWSYFPLYRAESLIECITNVPESELSVAPERLREDEHERFVQTQAVMLKSPSVLTAALGLRAVQDTNWYKKIDPGEYLLELTDDLVAGPVRGTNFLRVSIQCRTKSDPKTIVNNVVDRWHQLVMEGAARAYADELEGARNREDRLRAEIAAKREQLRTISDRLPAGAADANTTSLTAQQVLQYGQQVGMLALEKSLLEQYREIYNDPQGVAVTAEDRAAVEQDPQVSMLVQRLFMLQQQQMADAATFGPEHTEVKALEPQVRAAEEELDRIRQQRLSERRADIREATNTAYQGSQFALFMAQENLAQAEASLQDQDRLMFDYRNLSDDIERDLLYLVRLHDYVEELERVVVRHTAMKVAVAQRAIDPLRRSAPSLLMLPVGIFFALVLSVGLAVGLELIDTSMRTTQDITRHLEIAMLGAIPDTDDEEIAIEQVETAVRDAPRSMVAEAFRRVRAGLQFSAPASQQRSVLISSPHPHDGKTTVVCNLGLAVAQNGRRVLLVDANFRRPMLSKVFGLNGNTKGLSNILVGDGALADCAAPSNFPYLDVLSSGPIPPNPAELLGGETFRAFLDDATARYDQVLIDSPPVLLTSDAVVISTAVDGAILVVRAKENSRGAARRACHLLSAVNARLFGAVLNAAQATRGGYFRAQLREFYDYQADQEEDENSPPALPAETATPEASPKTEDASENGKE